MIDTVTDAGARPRMLRISHPGTPLEWRAAFVRVAPSLPERLCVPEGEDLFAVIHARLDMRGAHAGAFDLVSGELAELRLMTGGAGSDGNPMGFRGPHRIAVPARIEVGAGHSGIDEAGHRFSHCHAAFADRAGRAVGGHLMAGQAIAGPGGVAVDLVLLSGGRFVQRLDSETRFTIFHPEAV